MADGNLHISPPLQDPRNHNLWHLITRARNPQPGESPAKTKSRGVFPIFFSLGRTRRNKYNRGKTMP
jgi:hypothetical protein